MEKLLGKTPSQLKEIALSAGLPGFTGNQLAQWIYGKRVRTIAEMTNLSGRRPRPTVPASICSLSMATRTTPWRRS